MALRLLNQPPTTQRNQPPGAGGQISTATVEGVNFQTVFTRTDPLADVAGLEEGFHEGRLDKPIARQVAQLCRDAGADPQLIPGMS